MLLFLSAQTRRGAGFRLFGMGLPGFRTMSPDSVAVVPGGDVNPSGAAFRTRPAVVRFISRGGIGLARKRQGQLAGRGAQRPIKRAAHRQNRHAGGA